MSILRFCDHRILVYRFDPETADRDEYLDILPGWGLVPVPAGLNATLQRNFAGNLQDRGPGEIQASMRMWFLLPEFDIQERDVISVVSGPETGKLYRVEAVTAATKPLTVHHYEVTVSVAEPDILTATPAETS